VRKKKKKKRKKEVSAGDQFPTIVTSTHLSGLQRPVVNFSYKPQPRVDM
jgi:hypothetical protein